MIPEVKFKIVQVKYNLPLIYGFLNLSQRKKDWDWSDRIYRKYPDIKEKISKVKGIEEKKKIVEKYFTDFEEKNHERIRDSKEEFEKIWNKINDRVMYALSDVMEIEWPPEDQIFWARLSLNPICPRWIKKRIFDVYFNAPVEYKIEIAIHEISHFLYFEKWKSVFPDTDEKHFDAPHLIWQLSEIVTPIILEDKRIHKFFSQKPKGYDEYEIAKIEGKPLPDYFIEFYEEKRDFEDFLRTSWRFVKKHEKVINNIK